MCMEVYSHLLDLKAKNEKPHGFVYLDERKIDFAVDRAMECKECLMFLEEIDVYSRPVSPSLGSVKG